MILALLESGDNGIHVGEIVQKTHLFRPALSHHLQVLKDAGMLNMRRAGRKNYSCLDKNESQGKTLYEVIAIVYTGIQHIRKDDPRKGE